jgi:hypothetical protein
MVMTNFLQRVRLHCQIELCARSGKQVLRKILQCFQLLIADICAIVLLKPEDKEPPVTFISGHQSSATAALAAAR